jgi:hypothetical protein
MLVTLVKLKSSFVLARTLQSPHHANSALVTPGWKGGMAVVVSTLTGHYYWPLLLPKSKEFLGRSDRFH